MPKKKNDEHGKDLGGEVMTGPYWDTDGKGNVNIQIAGKDSDHYGQISSAGTVILGHGKKPKLDVQLANGVTLSKGDEFAILVGNWLSLDFDLQPLPQLPSGLDWDAEVVSEVEMSIINGMCTAVSYQAYTLRVVAK